MQGEIGSRGARALRASLDWTLEPFRQFSRLETAGGILLLICTAAALVIANSPLSDAYFHWLHHEKLGVVFGDWALKMSLGHWINDALMAVFFFHVGLEIKREFMVGELSSLRKAALPLIAALGGMVVPAFIYFESNLGQPTSRGWGIPMATDIAFALGVLTLLGRRVPVGIKVFLAALAIVDDIGAVLVIAVFYTAELSMFALVAGGIVLLVSLGLNVAGVRRMPVYAMLGTLLWLFVLASGVHATIAGVLMAMTIPTTGRDWRAGVERELREAAEKLSAIRGPGDGPLTNRAFHDALHAVDDVRATLESPLLRLEHALGPVVAFFIMPVFALANAGVRFEGDLVTQMGSPICLGVMAGLFIGKQVGVFGFSWLAIKMGIGQMPEGATPRMLYGTALLAGIGFTMSLFIANLAFPGGAGLADAKVGILAASLLSGTVGYVMLRFALVGAKAAGEGESRAGR